MSTIVEELTSIARDTLYAKWDIRKGTTVPTTDTVKLQGGGVELEAVVLYSDLRRSSALADDFQRRTAAKIVKLFFCRSRPD